LPKRIPIALLLAGGICLSGCSKTQDTAPATRVFGSPPVIESVNLASGGTTGQAICDYGPVIKNAFCADGEQFAEPFPAILVTVNYTEATFSVKVSDPESTASNSDILLVSASYQTTKDSTPTEVSLVMLDDGGSRTARRKPAPASRPTTTSTPTIPSQTTVSIRAGSRF
jgi:hypothetical protein